MSLHIKRVEKIVPSPGSSFCKLVFYLLRFLKVIQCEQPYCVVRCPERPQRIYVVLIGLVLFLLREVKVCDGYFTDIVTLLGDLITLSCDSVCFSGTFKQLT